MKKILSIILVVLFVGVSYASTVVYDDAVQTLTNKTFGDDVVIEGDLHGGEPGYFQRPVFEVSSTAGNLKISGGRYNLDGVGVVYNNTTLDCDLGTLAADDWYYVYLDASDFSGPGAFTCDELVVSTTEWAVDYAKGGQYNSADRGIFAVYGTGATSYTSFKSRGENVDFTTRTTITSSKNPATYTHYTAILPVGALGFKYYVYVYGTATGTCSISIDGTNSITDIAVSAAAQFNYITNTQAPSSSGGIYAKSSNTNHTYSIYQMGISLPWGM